MKTRELQLASEYCQRVAEFILQMRNEPHNAAQKNQQESSPRKNLVLGSRQVNFYQIQINDDNNVYGISKKISSQWKPDIINNILIEFFLQRKDDGASFLIE